MGFERRVITSALDLANLAKHNANFADIETDLNAHDERISEVETEQAAQSERIDNIVASGGESNIEIVDARQDYDTLRDRLDTEHSAVTAQLADIDQESTAIKTGVSKISILVDDFGAVGNGEHDDTLAIQAAINNAGGQPVLFTSGKTYFVSSIYYLTGTYLLGYGATLVADNPTIPAPMVGSDTYDNVTSFISGVTIEGLTFETRNLSFTQDGRVIKLRACKNVIIKNCYFKGFNGDGVDVDVLYNGSGQFRNFVPENIIIENCTFDGLGHDTRNSIALFQVDGISIRGCKFVNSGKSDMPGAVDIEPHLYHDDVIMVQNVSVTNCKFDGIKGAAGINAYFDYGNMVLNYPIQNFTFSGNTFKNMDKNFIYFEDRLSATNEPVYRFSHNLNVSNNTCEGSGNTYFQNMVFSGVRGLSFYENTIENAAGSIYIGKTYDSYAYKKCTDVKVYNNRIFKPFPVSEQVLFRIGNIETFKFYDNTVISKNEDSSKSGLFILAYVATNTYLLNNIIYNNVVYEIGSHQLFGYFSYTPTGLVTLRDNVHANMTDLNF